jgi:hypothetical protein
LKPGCCLRLLFLLQQLLHTQQPLRPRCATFCGVSVSCCFYRYQQLSPGGFLFFVGLQATGAVLGDFREDFCSKTCHKVYLCFCSPGPSNLLSRSHSGHLSCLGTDLFPSCEDYSFPSLLVELALSFGAGGSTHKLFLHILCCFSLSGLQQSSAYSLSVGPHTCPPGPSVSSFFGIVGLQNSEGIISLPSWPHPLGGIILASCRVSFLGSV